MNFYSTAQALFEDWAEDKPKQFINFIVEYLDEDKYWLQSNISKADKETLVSITKYLDKDND